MIVYGIKIHSDIELSLEYTDNAEYRYEIEFISGVPKIMKEALQSKFLLEKTPVRDIYLHSDHKFDKEMEKYKDGQICCYEVQNVVKFFWKAKARKIYYELGKNGNIYLLSFWFIKDFLALYMSIEQMYNIIHAGAIEIENKVILFSAQSTGGKSTFVNYFINKGHKLVSDDYVAVYKSSSNKIMTTSSYPYCRPFREYEVFGVKADNILKSFKPIHVIYILDKADKDADVLFEELTGYEKFHVLLPNYMYNILQIKKAQLGLLADMLKIVKVFRVKRPWNLERIDEVYNAVCEHSKGLTK
jgi:hypothetical protein